MDSREVKPEPQISSASDFKKKADERNKPRLLELPSGLVIKVKKPQLARLLKEKAIPAELLNAVYSQAGIGEDKEIKPDFSKSIEFIDKMIIISVVEPTIKDEPDYNKGEISIEDLSEEDKNFIFSFINGVGGSGQSDLATFRK